VHQRLSLVWLVLEMRLVVKNSGSFLKLVLWLLELVRALKSPSVLVVNWLGLVDVRRFSLPEITVVAHGVHSLRRLI
jgi:hypothetical protein